MVLPHGLRAKIFSSSVRGDMRTKPYQHPSEILPKMNDTKQCRVLTKVRLRDILPLLPLEPNPNLCQRLVSHCSNDVALLLFVHCALKNDPVICALAKYLFGRLEFAYHYLSSVRVIYYGHFTRRESVSINLRRETTQHQMLEINEQHRSCIKDLEGRAHDDAHLSPSLMAAL